MNGERQERENGTGTPTDHSFWQDPVLRWLGNEKVLDALLCNTSLPK